MLSIRTAIYGALAAAMVPMPAAAAKPPGDCAMRDSPFSADSPLVDILLSPVARDLLVRDYGLNFEKAPPIFSP